MRGATRLTGIEAFSTGGVERLGGHRLPKASAQLPGAETGVQRWPNPLHPHPLALQVLSLGKRTVGTQRVPTGPRGVPVTWAGPLRSQGIMNEGSPTIKGEIVAVSSVQVDWGAGFRGAMESMLHLGVQEHSLLALWRGNGAAES